MQAKQLAKQGARVRASQHAIGFKPGRLGVFPDLVTFWPWWGLQFLLVLAKYRSEMQSTALFEFQTFAGRHPPPRNRCSRGS